MTGHIWDDLLSARDQAVIEKAGYDKSGAASWESRGLGRTPAVVVIDMQRLVIGPNAPLLEAIDTYRTAMGEIAYEAMEVIAPLLDDARTAGVPVMYTRVVPQSYDDPAHPDLAIAPEVAPESDEVVIDKSYASAFYGTDLLSRLVAGGHDAVIIVGNSTSGCVRATAIDAKQNGFSVIIPEDAVFDRIEASHKVSLLDLWMKYAEVLPMEEVDAYLGEVSG
jgi:Amidases related to nicotinamidase